MTLLEIATFCAETLGMTDNLTIEQAKKFARARWKMVWDAANWKQAHLEVLDTVPAGVEEVELPAEAAFVTGVRIAGNRELLPSDATTQLAVDPMGFGNGGPTYAFSPMPKSDTGAARIRLHRKLDQAQELLVICKRKCPELAADGDTPLIAGIDQCLIAFTLGDLYRWLRAFPKANELYSEATAHLMQMKQIETVQTAQTVRLIPYIEPSGYQCGNDWLTQK